jgi:hypothetical protein
LSPAKKAATNARKNAPKTNAANTNSQKSSEWVADQHDVIRVQGARVNNLKDVSVELPKRRLTVFTGFRVRARAHWSSARSRPSRSG